MTKDTSCRCSTSKRDARFLQQSSPLGARRHRTANSLLTGNIATAAGYYARRTERARLRTRTNWSAPTHFAAKVKRVIYLCQSGAPSQIDTFDYKPTLDKLNGQDLPDSVRGGQTTDWDDVWDRSRSRLPSRLCLSNNTGIPDNGSATCCPTITKLRTTSVSFARCTPRRSITTRQSRFSKRGTSNRGGQVWARGLVTDWVAKARTCRPMSCCSTRTPTRRLSRFMLGLWGSAFLAVESPGRQVTFNRRSSACI